MRHTAKGPAAARIGRAAQRGEQGAPSALGGADDLVIRGFLAQVVVLRDRGEDRDLDRLGAVTDLRDAVFDWLDRGGWIELLEAAAAADRLSRTGRTQSGDLARRDFEHLRPLAKG